MSKVMLLVLGVPFVFASVLASVSFAHHVFVGGPVPVQATGAGVDSREGYAMTTLKSGDFEYLVISTAAPYVSSRESDRDLKVHTLTFYEIKRKEDGKADLLLVGTRVIEWDRGFESMNFDLKRIERPEELRKRR